MNHLNLPEPIAAYFAAAHQRADVVARRFIARAVVRAKMTGNFPGSPIDLRDRFALKHDRRALPEITA